MLKNDILLATIMCVGLLMGAQSALGADQIFPGSVGFSITAKQSEASFLFALEKVMLSNGFQLDARAVPAEHSFTYNFRWTKPGTEKDFWRADNKWQGEGELTARQVPGASDSGSAWRITFKAKTYSYGLSRVELESWILELLQAKLPDALASEGGK